MDEYWLVILDRMNGYFYNANYQASAKEINEVSQEFTSRYPHLIVLDIGIGARPQSMRQLDFIDIPQI